MSLYTGQYLYLDDSGHRADMIIKIIFKNGNDWSMQVNSILKVVIITNLGQRQKISIKC